MKELRVSYIIDLNHLVLNIGETDGLDPNLRFLIYGLSDEDIIDPTTGESLGRLELVRGTGVISYMQERMCIIKSDSFSPFNSPQIGDHVRII